MVETQEKNLNYGGFKMIVNLNSKFLPMKSIIFYDNYISFNHYASSIFSKLLTVVDRAVFNYKPCLRYRREIITRYKQPVNIIRDMKTNLFASRRNYNNTIIKELAIKSIYLILRCGASFIYKLINQKVNTEKNAAMINQTNPLCITMKSDNIIQMYKNYNFEK